MNENVIASEACGSDAPQGSHVAELNASQMRGKTADDRIPILTTSKLTLAGQLTGPISCPTCLTQGLNDISLGSRNLDKHFKSRHPSINLSWSCRGCCKVLSSVHAWRCHVAKCPGPNRAPDDNLECLECSKKFRTKSGLSQHERHDHP